MRLRVRVRVAIALAVMTTSLLVAPAGAQTGGLDSASLWVLIASLAQIVGAAAVMVFFITRGRSRRCPRCGQRLERGSADCARCRSGSSDRRRPPTGGG